jgi:hypothetical protein
MGSRAEYLRAYRAARRTELADHVCEGCGETFTPKRTDARFCKAACRSARWRPIVHYALDHQPGGFPIPPNVYGYPGFARCGHVVNLDPVEWCGQTATWRLDHASNEALHLIYSEGFCDEHIAAHRPTASDLVVGEGIWEVAARHGRADRKRQGKAV